MRRYAFIPSAPAPLEERITPSHSGLATAAAIQPAVTISQSVHLYGFIIGSDTTVGTMHSLQAKGGRISPLGTVSLRGYLVIPNTGTPSVAAHGQVTISNAQGTITVALSGTVTAHKTPKFTYYLGNLTEKIVSGTGAYSGATGTGPVLFGPGPVLQPGRFMLDFGNYPPPP